MKKDRRSKPPLSLRARGVQLLSHREHSVSELGKKLQRHARLLDAAAVCRAASTEGSDDAEARVKGRFSLDGAASGSTFCSQAPAAPAPDAPSTGSAMDAVADTLAWLQTQGFLSDERFTQSRVYARSARFGNLRIRQELDQHQVELTDELAQVLQNSELERARAVFQRKFCNADGISDAARQARFLKQRGFSSHVVHQVLRAASKGNVTER